MPVGPGAARQRGFSLVEAVVALLIFATGVLGITRLQSVAVQQTGTAAFRTQAALLTKNLIATMWLSDRTPANFEANFDSSRNGPQVSVSAVPGGTGSAAASNQVTVIVYWKGPGDPDVHRYTETAQIK
jgi:type IV pilus assembly protein PilV